MRVALVVAIAFSASVLPVQGLDKPQKAAKALPAISWKKTIVDRAFRSEGVAVADVNKDGKMDIIVGDVWYEAPDWKVHVIRADRTFDPLKYSESFGVYADDFNGDGWPDVLIIPFPGAPCRWYENPGKSGGKWKEHEVSHSACNETPHFVDLFGTGKRVLIMGVQPKGKEDMGQMFWLRPGKDPAEPWEHHPISAASEKGKEIPCTRRFSHGLGIGDVNGDGRMDVLCTAGWWEQPARLAEEPWQFHPADLGPDCANMHGFDFDGDGRNDVISSSAHQIGMWWHQQKGPRESPTFIRNELALGAGVVADKKNYLLTQDEKSFLDEVNKVRAENNLPGLRPVPLLCNIVRAHAGTQDSSSAKSLTELAGKRGYMGMVEGLSIALEGNADQAGAVKALLKDNPKILLAKWLEIGVGFSRDDKGVKCAILLGKGATSPLSGIVVWESMKKHIFSQTHALHFVDVNGDGVKDLVTGRRVWAHGPRGDVAPNEPAFLCWFEGKRGKDGIATFLPHIIDDASGIGTQFAIADVNGDGALDVIVSNKNGVFIFVQVRTPAVSAVPERKD